jgi:hypothetical protein
MHKHKPAGSIQVKPMAKLLSILLIALFSLTSLVTSLHNHKGPEDHYACSFCLLVRDFSAMEVALKPVLIIPQVNKAVFTPKSFKSLHTSIPSIVQSRAPPVSINHAT